MSNAFKCEYFLVILLSMACTLYADVSVSNSDFSAVTDLADWTTAGNGLVLEHLDRAVLVNPSDFVPGNPADIFPFNGDISSFFSFYNASDYVGLPDNVDTMSKLYQFVNFDSTVSKISFDMTVEIFRLNSNNETDFFSVFIGSDPIFETSSALLFNADDAGGYIDSNLDIFKDPISFDVFIDSDPFGIYQFDRFSTKVELDISSFDNPADLLFQLDSKTASLEDDDPVTVVYLDNIEITTAEVPLPGAVLMGILGFGTVGIVRRRDIKKFFSE